MNKIEYLMSQYPNLSFEFESMPPEFGGFNIGEQIIINSDLPERQQIQWLYEEIGHSETSVGDISDYNQMNGAKQERLARRWGFMHALSENDIKDLKSSPSENDYELADDLGVQVNFLHEIGFSYGLHFKHVTD